MNLFLAGAPGAEVVHGELACMLSVADLADRPPRAMADGEVLDLGTHRLRFVPTAHVPHNWESGLWFDETTATLLAGDLFTQTGVGPALTEDGIGSRPWPPRSCSTRRPWCPTCRPPCSGSPTSSP
jgi:flavorubredoxin